MSLPKVKTKSSWARIMYFMQYDITIRNWCQYSVLESILLPLKPCFSGNKMCCKTKVDFLVLNTLSNNLGKILYQN